MRRHTRGRTPPRPTRAGAAARSPCGRSEQEVDRTEGGLLRNTSITMLGRAHARPSTGSFISPLPGAAYYGRVRRFAPPIRARGLAGPRGGRSRRGGRPHRRRGPLDPVRRAGRGRRRRVVRSAAARGAARRRDLDGDRDDRLVGGAPLELRPRGSGLLQPEPDGRPGRAERRERAHGRARVRATTSTARPRSPARASRTGRRTGGGPAAWPSSSGSAASPATTRSTGAAASPRSSPRTTRGSRSARRSTRSRGWASPTRRCSPRSRPTSGSDPRPRS